MGDVHVTTYIHLCCYIRENFVSIYIETDTCVWLPMYRIGSFTLRVDDLLENVICLFGGSTAMLCLFKMC